MQNIGALSYTQPYIILNFFKNNFTSYVQILFYKNVLYDLYIVQNAKAEY